MRERTRAIVALAAGGVLALGGPPFNLWPVVFVCALAFARVLRDASPRRAMLAGWLMGVGFTIVAHHWLVPTVTRFTGLPTLAAVVFLLLHATLAGVTLGLAGLLSGLSSPTLGRPLALGVAILVAERWAPAIFPWQFAAIAAATPAWPQAADLVGVGGLSAFLLAGAALVVDSLRREAPVATAATVATSATAATAATGATAAAKGGARRVRFGPPAWKTLTLGVVVIAWPFVYGVVRMPGIRRALASAPTIRVALLQPAIPPTVRWESQHHTQILDDLQRLTASALEHAPQIVVWSEGAFPFPLPHRAGQDGENAPPIVPYGTDASIVTGAVTVDASGRRRNSAVLREPDGTIQAPVSKRVLVPFGEYVPFLWRIEWVRRTFARADGLVPGDEPAYLRTRRGVRLGVLNCFEDTLGSVAVDLADADLLVNITNDAWFGESVARWQHLFLARWRSIELRRELVRSVDTGVTAYIDGLGQVASTIPPGPPSALVVNVRRLGGRTLARWVIPWAPRIAAIVLAVSLVAARRRRR